MYRIVCGACKDFKVIVAAPLAEYDAWDESGATLTFTSLPRPHTAGLFAVVRAAYFSHRVALWAVARCISHVRTQLYR